MAVMTETGREDLGTIVGGKETCRHHWMIEEADGPVSIGTCRLCGARKRFCNYLADCVQATEEEYENWLAKQKDYSRPTRIAERRSVAV